MAANDATTMGIAYDAVVLPLTPLVAEEGYTYHEVTHKVNVGTDGQPEYVKKKAKVPIAVVGQPECLLRTVSEFHDVCSNNRLRLDTGELQFEKFRECLHSDMRHVWDDIIAGINIDVVGFATAIDLLIAQQLPAGAEGDQTRYLQGSAKKPYRMTVQDLAARIRKINQLMRWFPGNPFHVPPYNEQQMKTMFFQMMPRAWQQKYVDTGREITDAAVTFISLSQYMERQQTQATNSRRLEMHRGEFRGGGRRGNSGYHQRRRLDYNGNYSRGGFGGRSGFGRTGNSGYGRVGRGNYGRGDLSSGRSPVPHGNYGRGQGGAFGRGGRGGGRAFGGRGGRFGGRGGRFGGGRGRGSAYYGEQYHAQQQQPEQQAQGDAHYHEHYNSAHGGDSYYESEYHGEHDDDYHVDEYHGDGGYHGHEQYEDHYHNESYSQPSCSVYPSQEQEQEHYYGAQQYEQQHEESGSHSHWMDDLHF